MSASADPKTKRATRSQKRLAARVVAVGGPDEGSEWEVGGGGARVGAGRGVEIRLSDKTVDDVHLELVREGESLVLRDRSEGVGTFFYGVRVRELELESGVEVRLGATRLRFDFPDASAVVDPLAGMRFGRVCGRSSCMGEVMSLMKRVAPSELSVLITGETGTGKERLARSIHEGSERADGPYVVLDCSSIPRDLAESAMFGHQKGAFTGAVSTHKGIFEQADGGTIFLDEVGELDLALQPKLLRVLETHELKRVGGDETIHANVRVVAATNRDLQAMVSEGSFREDLYFRLSVVQCAMPALRERPEDIGLLAQELLEGFSERRPDLGALSLASEALEALARRRWPGNVRELKNTLERAVSLADSAILGAADVQLPSRQNASARGGGAPEEPLRLFPAPQTAHSPVGYGPAFVEGESFKDAKQRVVDHFERAYLSALLTRTHGNLSRAAREIGLTRFHLRELLKKHRLLETFREGNA